MTRIHFYFNVSNKPAAIVNMVRAGIAKRRTVTISTEDEQAATQISAALWQAEADSFLPHLPTTHAMAAFAPVHIHWHDASLLHDDMLINLNAREPIFFTRFRHLIELVGEDEADKAAARARFKFYRDRGYEIKSTDFTKDVIK